MTLRVAHLSTSWRSGAGAMIRIHDALGSQGVQSHVYCTDPLDESVVNGHTVAALPAAPRRWWSDRTAAQVWQKRISRASDSNADFEAFSPPIASQDWDWSGLRNALGRSDFDVLHLHWAGGLFDFESFFDGVDVPIVWTLHDQNPYLGGFHYQHDVDAATAMLPLEYESRDIKRRALANVSLTLAANSDWSARAAEGSSVVNECTTIETAYLPIPVDSFVATEKLEAKRALGIDPENFVIGFASAALSGRRKGFLDLVAALERLPEAIRNRTTVLSFGHAPGKKARAMVTLDWTHLGHISDVGKQSVAYSAMDVFVIASTEEAFGQTPVEALMCGTAVMGSDVGGIPETIVDGETGLLFPHRDPTAMVRSMVQCYENPAKRLEMAAAGRKHVQTRHAIDRVAREHIEIYRSAIERHKQSLSPLTAG